MFEQIQKADVDQLMTLLKKFAADERPGKVNLVVGVYADDTGNVPVLNAVKLAEERILQSEVTKNYVSIAGSPELREVAPTLLLGNDNTAVDRDRITCVQTPGGTGALRVGADALSQIHHGNRIWVSTPTWANHVPIINASGLTPLYHPYFSPERCDIDFDAMMEHLEKNAKSGDIILLHACCHNPTGIDLNLAQWKIITEFVVQRGIFPFVDCAYQGFGNGLDEDVEGLRHMAARAPEMLIASSFSKNFGIYRERCGALTAIAHHPEKTPYIATMLESVIRSNYSMPPNHGASIVSTIMNDNDLKSQWQQELKFMRKRILSVRKLLQQKLEEQQVTRDTSFLTKQNGMFSYTGFTPSMVARLQDEFAIYTARDGRINVAGIFSSNIDLIAEGFASIMKETP